MKPGMLPEFCALLRRYCAVACLLPKNDMDFQDANVGQRLWLFSKSWT